MSIENSQSTLGTWTFKIQQKFMNFQTFKKSVKFSARLLRCTQNNFVRRPIFRFCTALYGGILPTVAVTSCLFSPLSVSVTVQSEIVIFSVKIRVLNFKIKWAFLKFSKIHE